MRRPRSLPDTVMAEIQRVFVKRNLKVGDRLPPERELARQLSVGRSSLREARGCRRWAWSRSAMASERSSLASPVGGCYRRSASPIPHRVGFSQS